MITSEEFFNKLEHQAKERKPFVSYRKPDSSNIVKAILQTDGDLYKSQDLRESGFVFSAFNSESSAYLIPSDHSETLEYEFRFKEQVDDSGAEIIDSERNFPQSEIDQRDHENLVQSGIDEIKKGKLHKVVLSRSETVELYDPSPFRIFKNLLNKYPNAFVYLWYHPETSYWLGATPETLLQTERTRFRTMALAGTQIFKGSTNVEWGKKEVEEQLFVTDYISNTLEKMPAVKRLELSKPYSKKAGNLLHICTDISGYLTSEENIGELIKELHPTPAICGLPKEKALMFILENENYNREFYAGFLGELNLKTQTQRSSNRHNQENQQFSAISKKSDLYVNLRCMKLKDGNARIYVGGGITKDSHAGDEWMETVNKSQTMKAVLVK